MGAIPITVWKVNSGRGSSPRMERLAENAGETALNGVPALITSGYVGESPAINDANDKILGFTTEFFHNLTTDGVPKTLTYGAVQNQSAAVLIPVGAPLSDGNIGILVADDQTEFVAGAPTGTSFTQADIGVSYGLTKAANNYWGVDKSKTTEAGGACIKITELVDASGTDGGRVAFTVNSNRQQLYNF